MYSVEEIKELLKAFDESKATKLAIQDANGERLTITQKTETAIVSPATEQPAAVQVTVEKPSAAAPLVHEEKQPAEDGTPVAAPMIGVFYAAPSPDKDPYVTVGSKVNKAEVLCLIEAMKLMNEVTAERSGEIAAVCVENGQVVEFGQTLFRIK